MTVELRPCGATAWLVETDDVLGLTAAIRDGHAAAGVPVADIVPAARTVLVTLDDAAALDAAARWLSSLTLAPAAIETGHVVEIPVVYDGEDLADVAEATGLDVAEVIARHQRPLYVSAFCGFAPGFAYLTGLDDALILARRVTPRTRVPAGSVAIAAEYAAVYPSVSPGGWHLLGRTETQLWDLDHRPPALLAPGTSVRFVEAS